MDFVQILEIEVVDQSEFNSIFVLLWAFIFINFWFVGANEIWDSIAQRC